MLATWSDEDSSSLSRDESREISNLCLMAKEDSDVSDSDTFTDSSYYSSDSENESNITFKKLCKILISNLEKSREKYKVLKKENTALHGKLLFWKKTFRIQNSF